MQVRRLDLGAEVVAIPSRDLLVIHPDLEYADALGAVMGTLPDLHPDAAVALVEQVTPRPEAKPRPVGRILLAACAILIGLATLTVGHTPPAAASLYGDLWDRQMAEMGMTCQEAREGVTVCVDGDRDLVRVEGFHRPHSALYVMSGHEDHGCRYMRVFDEEWRAEEFADEHSFATRSGRVVVW